MTKETKKGSYKKAPTQKTIELNAEERQAIEQKRHVEEQKKAFLEGYKKLVEETNFALAVDTSSAIANPALTIVRFKPKAQ